MLDNINNQYDYFDGNTNDRYTNDTRTNDIRTNDRYMYFMNTYTHPQTKNGDLCSTDLLGNHNHNKPGTIEKRCSTKLYDFEH